MLGLTSFINSDLTWKGSKGYRSSSRLAKKSVSRNLKGSGELFDQNLKTVNMPVCESEKLGVKVLGCRFGENAEHVPIKKRRFVYRSPSPPPRAPSPHSAETDNGRLLKIEPNLIDSAASLKDVGQIVDNDSDVDEINLKRVKGRADENEDFSGISILAAAACSNGNAADVSAVKESSVHNRLCKSSKNDESCSLPKGVCKDDLSSAKISTGRTGLPSEEFATCLRTDRLSASGLSHGKNMEGTPLQDHPVASKDISSGKDEETVRKQGSFSRDDRLYWDLNAPLDSWEHPFDYEVADSNTNIVDGIAEDVDYGDHINKTRNLEGHKLPGDHHDSEADAGKERPPGNSAEKAHESPRSEIEDHKLDVCVNSEGPSYLQDRLLSSELGNVVKVDQGKETLHGQERASTGAGSVLVPVDDAKRLLVFNNEDKNTSDHDVSIGCAINNDSLSVQEVEVEDEKGEVASLLAFPGKTTGVVGDCLNKAVDDAKEVSSSLDDARNRTGIVALEIGDRLKTKHLDNVTEDPFCSAPLGVEITTSAALVENQPALAVDLKVEHAKASVDGDAETDTLVHINREAPTTECIEKSTEMLQAPPTCSSDGLSRSNCVDPVNSSDMMSLQEPLDYDCYSDVSHDHDHVKSSELEVDYDSQYEDGEVRDSIVHSWEEYDGEDMEAEQVDYGSDSGNSLSCEAAKRVKHTQETIFPPCASGSSASVKEKSLERKEGRNEVETGDEAGPAQVTEVDIVAMEDDIKKPSLSADSTLKLSGEQRKFSDAMTRVGDGSRKKLAGDCMDVMDSESAKNKMVVSREFRRELRSHIEGRSLRDMYFKDKTCTQGSRGRYTQHAHGRREEGDRWFNSFDSHRGLKRHHSPNYHRRTSFRHPGPEGSISRQKMDASSLSAHWRLTRSGLPFDRDEDFRLRMGFRPSRELSPDRRMTLGRGRSFRYDPRLDGRGLRGRYHGPIPDDCSGPSLNKFHPSSKKERSFSPIERRGKDSARNSHSKSPPRSRTRSPNSANPRHRSKSPNFRSDVRMQRGRSPHQQSGVVSDRMVGLRTVQRLHGSPPHNSRWIGDWKDDMVHFRERARFSPRDERFDFVGPPRNYRSMHTGRFPEIEGVGRGRTRFDRSDENRERHGYRYGLVPPAKRYEMGGAVKQFRYNGGEGFVKARDFRYRNAADFYGRGSPKEFGRSIESSVADNVPRRFREERGPFIHQRDEKYNSNSKSFELRENDDDIDSTRRLS